jgi:hypothetical protein
MTTNLPEEPRDLIAIALAALNKLGHPEGGCGGPPRCGYCNGNVVLAEAREAITKCLEVLP